MAGQAIIWNKVKSKSGKEYTLHLEFAETPGNIGEEIRNLLKEKVIMEKTGWIQKGGETLPSPGNEKRGRST